MRDKRRRIVYVNSIITLIGQVLQTLLGFWLRKAFIDNLGVSLLGVDSVFHNILQMLNMADLGISLAVSSFLYKPLAEGNEEAIASLMSVYKKIYQVICAIVLVGGIIVSFFLGNIIPDANCSMLQLQIFFYLSLAGTVVSYICAYQRTLYIADQKAFITSAVDTIAFIIMAIGQLIVLYFIPNYFLYLLFVIIKNLGSNVAIQLLCRRDYKYLKGKVNSIICKEYQDSIIGYMKNMIVSKFGAYIFYGTDNIIISIFKGSLMAGYLSNYSLITVQLEAVISQVLSSIQGTYGNLLNLTKDKKEQLRLTDMYFWASCYIGIFCSSCTVMLLQPLIKLFFGAQYVLNDSTVYLLSINLMLALFMKIPYQIFVIFDLYKYDKPVIAVSATLNIVISAILVNSMGINGVLIGTLFTSLIYLYSRLYIISKRVFSINITHFYGYCTMYILFGIVCMCMMKWLLHNYEVNTLFRFVLSLFLVAILGAATTAVFMIYSKSYRNVVSAMIPAKIRFVFKRKAVIANVIICILCCVLINAYMPVNKDIAVDSKNNERHDSYIVDNISMAKNIHISYDDVIYVFKDLEANKDIYDSIFDNPTFSYMKKLHDEYGVVQSCYVYYESEDFNLSKCTSKFRQEFIDNSEWLRFGFHSLNSKTIYNLPENNLEEDYILTLKELVRIVGRESIDQVPRLHGFAGDEKSLVNLHDDQYLVDEKINIIGLLAPDDGRQCYYLNSDDSKYVYSHDYWVDVNNDIEFYSTDLRFEYIKDIDKKIGELDTSSWNNQRDFLIIFTHEWQLDNVTKKKCEKVCEYAINNGYTSLFPEDLTMIQ